MAESYIGKRVFLSKGKQRNLIEKVLSKISVPEAAKIAGVCERTIRDWRQEKFLMDYLALCKLCEKTKMPIPRNIKLKDRYWYVAKGAKIGWLAMFKKYGRIGGDPEYRKKKWYEWWERKGKYQFHPIIGVRKLIRRPLYSEKLAEFVGIVLGDGGITQRQVVISLNGKDENEYGKFVVDLVKNLFNVPVHIYRNSRDSVVDLVVSRTELVCFCVEKLGLKIGNKIKQQVDIPYWIKENERYSIACVRGLVDTDGCVFTHRYKVKGKLYSYKKICFTSRSEPLRQSVFQILKSLHLNPRLAVLYDVRIDSQDMVARYFRIIGSHNLKNLNKYFK